MIKKILALSFSLTIPFVVSNIFSASAQEIEPKDPFSPSCDQYIIKPDWRGFVSGLQIPVDPIPVGKIVCVGGYISDPIVQAVFDDNFAGNIAYGTRQGIYTGFFEDGSVRVSHYTKNRDGIIVSLNPIDYPEMYLRVGNLKFEFQIDPSTKSYRLSKKAVEALTNAYTRNQKVLMFFSPQGLVNQIGSQTLIKLGSLFIEYTPNYEPVGVVITSKNDPLYIPPTVATPRRTKNYRIDDINRKEEIDHMLEYGF
jgi:hypothetical protein